MNDNILDILFDEENTDPITLYNEQNEPVEFEQIAIIPLAGSAYVILKPVEPVEGVAEDEALVFAILEDGDDASLEIVEDDAVIDSVFAEYYKLLEECDD